MKKLLLFIPIIILVATLITVSVYYFTAFNQVNNLIKIANSGKENKFQGNEIISSDNFKLLQSVDRVDSNTDYYINGGTLFLIKKLGLDTVSFQCISNYKVINAKEDKVMQTVSKRKFIVNLKYDNKRWVINEVKEITAKT